MMKFYNVTKMIFVLLTISSINAETLTSRTYEGKCFNTHPLSTYQVCDEDSYLGLSAAHCAEDAAIDDCREDKNVDCVPVSTTVWSVASKEFPGFRVCWAKVHIRGYR